MLLETACLWTGPKENISRLELIVRQTIGVALKSNRSEAYIERLMALDEESQEDLGNIVQSCLAAIYENGSSSRGSAISNSSSEMKGGRYSEDVPGQGRIGLRATVSELSEAEISIEASMINLDERKHRDLQRQALIAERECLQLREKINGLERDIALYRTENDQNKVKVEELEKKSSALQTELDDGLSKQRETTDKEIAAYRSHHSDELKEKDRSILELKNEQALLVRQHEERLYRLQAELDESRESIIMLKKNEAVVEVYKKKVDQIGDLRIELAQALERNTHLNAENDLLLQDKENLRVFEGMVEKLQGDISKIKLISDQKDLSV